MKSLNRKAFYVFFLRYSPTLGVLAFIIHYSLIMSGVRTIMPDYIFDTSLLAFIFLWVSSKLFGFCPLHRHFITYIALGSLDIDIHHWSVIRHFPAPLVPCVMIGGGILLFACLAYKTIKRRHDEKGNSICAPSQSC